MSFDDRNFHHALVSVAICPQRIVVEMLVADERNARDAGGRSFIDRKNQVDAVLRPLNDLRIDGRGEFAVAAIEFDDALDVGLNLGAGEDRTRLQLNFLGQVLLGNLVFALEHDLIDDRVFDDIDRERRAVPIDLHVGEKARGEQCLQRAVDDLLVIGIAFVDREIGQDRRRLDALRALHHDLFDDRSGGLRAGGVGADALGCGFNACANAGIGMRPAAIMTVASAACLRRAKRRPIKLIQPSHRPPAIAQRVAAAAWFQNKFNRTRSFQVASTINPSMTASPSRNPTFLGPST